MCSFHPSSHFEDHVLFLAFPFNRSVVFSFVLSHLIKSCISSQPECGLKSCLPLVPFFSGGSVLLISTSIPSSCQVHVQFLPFTIGVLSKLYHSYFFSILFLTGVSCLSFLF